MFGRPKAVPPSADPPSWIPKVRELETRIESLETALKAQHVEVLNTMEKVLHQLRARERRRIALEQRENDEQEGGDTAPYPSNTAGLSARFRRF